MPQIVHMGNERLSQRQWQRLPVRAPFVTPFARRHVDAFLDLFTRESPRLERFIREESSQRAPPFFVDGGSIN